MNRFIFFPLMVLLLIAIFSILMGNLNPIAVEVEGESFTFNFDLDDAVMAALVGIIAGIVGVGIQILGSGLSEETIRTITTIIIYTAIWGILSVLAQSFIAEIDVFGAVIWGILSVLYVFGVGIEATESDRSE